MARSFIHELGTRRITAPQSCSHGSAGKSARPCCSLTAALNCSDQFPEVVGGELGVVPDAALGLLHLVDDAPRTGRRSSLRLGLHAEHHVAVHLYEAAVGVPCETVGLPVRLASAFDGGVVDARGSEYVSIMPGMEARAPERTETSSGMVSLAEASCPCAARCVSPLAPLRGAATSTTASRPVRVILRTYLGGDGEARGDGDADEVHFGQVGALAAAAVRASCHFLRRPCCRRYKHVLHLP